MVKETLKRIETNLAENATLPEEQRTELISLVDKLKIEIQQLETTNSEDAGSIVSYTESTLREATRTEPDDVLLQHTLDGLSLSVRRFEVSHPTLMGIINTISQVLSGSGI
jgi:predicted AlkP superfamily phosphohydrolase/phosphomutase